MNGLWLSIQLGISSSQLTNSYFSEGLGWNHQPEITPTAAGLPVADWMPHRVVTREFEMIWVAETAQRNQWWSTTPRSTISVFKFNSMSGWWWHVVTGTMEWILISHHVGNFIIPTDELIFFRGVQSSNQSSSICDSCIVATIPVAIFPTAHSD